MSELLKGLRRIATECNLLFCDAAADEIERKDEVIGSLEIQLQAAETWMNNLNAEIEGKDAAIAELVGALNSVIRVFDAARAACGKFEKAET